MIPVKDNIPSERVALVTLALVAINVGVYVWAVDGALLPLATNVLFLWIFGGSLEQAMGRLRFLLFYVLGGLATVAAAVSLGAEALPIVGSTGATAAVITGYLANYPRGRVLAALLIPFLFTIVAIPAMVFAGGWVALQVVFGLFDLNGGVGSDEIVAYCAPVAGMIFGAVAGRFFVIRRSAGYVFDASVGDSA